MCFEGVLILHTIPKLLEGKVVNVKCTLRYLKLYILFVGLALNLFPGNETFGSRKEKFCQIGLIGFSFLVFLPFPLYTFN